MKPRIMRAATRPTAKAEPANFVGTVLSDPVFAPEQPSRLRASRVSFMPGGRTNWHQHAVGQILYVLSGVGRYQLEGEPVQEIKPGDTVAVPPTVSASMRRVGWPTPTGTPWPSLPQVPMPGSSAMSLPTMPTLVSASEPAPIRVAPFTGAPSLPS